MKTYVYFLSVALFLIAAAPADAQFTSQQATDLVLGQLLNGELDNVDVFKIENVKSNQSAISLRNNETIDLPYASNWVFFVDDRPFANWAHACRYVFVDVVTGAYQVENKNFYPVDWKSAYTLVSEMPRPNPVDLPVNPDAAIDGLPPNPHLFAVIINGVDMDRYWNDVSAIYNTLIDVYGFTKENIFVHYDYGSSYLGDDLDDPDDPSDDIDYNAYKETILHTFAEMAGESNTSEEIPVLGPADGLFIFVTDHGFMDEGHSYILLPTQPLGDWEMAEAIEGINCAQIIALFEPCEIGGFKTELSDYVNYDVSCKNRSIQTASTDEVSWAELHITDGKYDEFVYYWTAAARGYYPDDDLPWEESYAVGSLPVEQYFPVYPNPNWHPGDFDPDLNGDGFVQMEEAFNYANAMDTWSDDGYYYYPAIIGEEPEDPQEFTAIGFSEYLLTICGLAGHATSPVTVQGNFIVGGNLIFDEVSFGQKFVFNNNSEIYMINPQSKITISANSQVQLKANCKIAGNSITNEVKINGKLSTMGDGIQFFGIDGGQWRGLVFDNVSNNINQGFANATFTDCLISGILSNITISTCLFTNSGIYLTASEVNISVCDFIRSYTSITRNPLAGLNDVNFYYNNFNGQGITKPAIEINSFGHYHIFYNEIFNQTDGIKIFNSGHEASQNLVTLSYIENCTGAGIKVYNSDISIQLNHVRYNGYGLMLYNRSNVELLGNELAEYISETNNIRDNKSYEVYSSRCFPHTFIWNAIIDEDNTEPMVYTVGVEGPYDVRHNFWGNNFDHVKDFYPWQAYLYIPEWYLMGQVTEIDPAEDLYISADISFTDSNYSSAKASFEQVISHYPNSRFVSASMKKLYDIEQYTGNNYLSLKQYYQNNTTIQGDTSLTKLADFLANFCDIKLENWPTAIAWFEDVIQQPETFEDSIFAIIDLGYTYWLMENSPLKSTYTGTMPQYKFASQKDYEENRDYLLSLLPGDGLSETMKQSLSTLKSGELLQNVPNPFNGTTSIWFKLTEESSVSLTICDYTGKEVSVINPGTLKTGNHSVEFNSTNLPSGIYFYSLEVNGIKTDTKKMTLMR